jgi:hypothetical protein
MAGTYTLQVQPAGTAAGSLTFLLSQSNVGAIAVDGPPIQFQSLPGQTGRYLFAGNAGDYIGLGLTALSSTPAGATVNVYVYKPDGSTLWNAGMTGPRSFQLPKLPATGTYSMAIQPASGASAAATVLLSKALGGTLVADGSTTTFETVRVGQAGRYVFDGVAGQRLTMQATLGGGFPTYGATITVYRPDGVPLVWSQFGNSLNVKLDLGALPASGTYGVTLEPSNLNTGTCAIRLIGYAYDTLTVDGASKTLSLGAAQNGRYSFTANAGDYIGLGLPTISTTPYGAGVSFNIYKPGGALLWSRTVTTPASAQLPRLQLTGNYGMYVVPNGTSAASAEVLLSRALSATLLADGSTTVFQSGRVGQAGRYQFDGVAGQRLTMQATAGGGFALYGATVTVYQPSGASFVSTQFGRSLDVKLDLGALPATGSYSVVVEPVNANTGSVALRLVSSAIDTLVVDGPPKTLLLGVAQNGTYTFTASAGDYIGFGVTSLSSAPESNWNTVTAAIYDPSGALLWSTNVRQTNYEWPKLPATGTYSLVVTPYGFGGTPISTSLTILLSRALTGMLVIDGTGTVYQTARAGQQGRYTFDAVAGQRLTMQATLGGGFPLNGASVTVYQPSGASIASGPSSVMDGKIDLGALPANGTYTAVVQPYNLSTGSLAMRLMEWASGTITVGAQATTLALVAAQNGRYAFTGSAGALLNLSIANVATYPPNALLSLSIAKPDGSYFWSSTTAIPRIFQLPALPATGVYGLTVSPAGTASAGADLQVYQR